MVRPDDVEAHQGRGWRGRGRGSCEGFGCYFCWCLFRADSTEQVGEGVVVDFLAQADRKMTIRQTQLDHNVRI